MLNLLFKLSFLNICRDVVNFKLNARKESKKVVLSSEARAALRFLFILDPSSP